MKNNRTEPIELIPVFRERVWGCDSLAPFYSTPPGERIGEVWFTFEENQTSSGKNLGQLLRDEPEILGAAADKAHPGICPILVKMLFTTERLSVQVHPDDAYGEKHHGSLGKTEAWYIVKAQDPGEIAAGFREEITGDRFLESVQSGEIENLLQWRKVSAGETIFVPAGTVHAIGAGLTVCEVQENSDITYRLYDYGRPRELHLEHGVRVSHLRPHTGRTNPISLGRGREELTACPYFRMERLRPTDRFRLSAQMPQYAILICVQGGGSMGAEEVKLGQAWLVPAGAAEVEVNAPGSEWILAYAAESAGTFVTVQ